MTWLASLALASTISPTVAPATASIGPAVGSWATAVLLQAQEKLGLEAFVTGTGRCPETVKVCVGLHVHPVVEDGEPVQTPLWFLGQLAHANKLFAAIGVGFEVASVTAAPPEHAMMQSRKQRDLLGRADHALGDVHIYVVRRLADVDVPGAQIRGVHWRDRAGKGIRRWIILSSVASHPVMAHELGHFFGLPHSSYAISIMNKKPASGRPTWPKRTFHPEELQIMSDRRDAMLGDKTLVGRKRPRRVDQTER